jgi:hypothetical protein
MVMPGLRPAPEGSRRPPGHSFYTTSLACGNLLREFQGCPIVRAAADGFGGAVDLDGTHMPTSRTAATLFSGWGETLAAVVAGNVFYFLARPLLPAALQHELFRLDAGLLVDFIFCGVALVLIRRVRRAEAR